ncbi:hypothetical protein PG994_000603 [Apiospora phragmitis]|uniref:LysM domain-containing protein n=1 Tax=Apiospora phragmitis TaxID=2905665 RepID=A0ABR1X6T2_9PEZI
MRTATFSLIATAALAAAQPAAPATAVCVVGGASSYTINAGDTLYLVSVALGITLDSLLAANKGVVPENHNVGDKSSYSQISIEFT